MTVRPTRLLLVVAHPDDETFGCGSLLLHAAARGATTAVCCATRGEAGEAPSGVDVGAVRERELHEAARVLGVSSVTLLGFADSDMTGEPAPGSLVAVPFEEVVDAVAGAIRELQPDVLVTLDASDGHRDHVRIRDAALEAARREQVAAAYLACLPRSLMKRWVERMSLERPDMAHLDPEIAAIGTPDDQITTVIDAAQHLADRERAIAVHASQTSPFEGLPANLRAAFLDTVHLQRVVPAWSGGAQETDLPL